MNQLIYKHFNPLPGGNRDKTMNYTYYDSEAGQQSQTFDKLSAIIKHIEDFGYNGDSSGTIFQDGEPIIEYDSSETGLTWSSVNK